MGETDPTAPRILLIAYSFPPSGGGGVQRPAKLAKIWTRRGAAVTVLAGPLGAASTVDMSLMRDLPGDLECVRAADPSPVLWAARTRRRVPNRGPMRPVDRLLVALGAGWSSICAPDHHSAWLFRAVPQGLRLARRFRPTVILATGPPFTSFLAGCVIASRSRTPLVLDYRDPWSAQYLPRQPTIGSQLNPTLERWTLRRAAGVVAAHRAVFRYLEQLMPGGRRLCRRRIWIPNGYDDDDFATAPTTAAGRFTLSYTGSFYGFRNPRTLLQVLDELLESGRLDPSKFRFRVAGLSGDVLRAKIRGGRIGSVLEVEDYLPHSESVRLLQESTVNLVLEGETGAGNLHSPGKFYEVLRAGRPVLLLCPEGVTPRLARRAGGCRIAHPDDREAIRKALVDYYSEWERGALERTPQRGALQFYDRARQADRFLQFLRDVSDEANRAEGDPRSVPRC